MEKFTSLKINENETELPDINMGTWTAKAGPIPQYALGAINPNTKSIHGGHPVGDTEPTVTKSEPAKFVSKIFEARQMAHVFHLQASGDGSYALHMALDIFYNEILELNDELIEVYQGQYDIIGDYETIEGTPSAQNAVQYFVELAQFIKDTRQMAFLPEDTHLQNIIDEIVSLVYKTLYKLKNLK